MFPCQRSAEHEETYSISVSNLQSHCWIKNVRDGATKVQKDYKMEIMCKWYNNFRSNWFERKTERRTSKGRPPVPENFRLIHTYHLHFNRLKPKLLAKWKAFLVLKDTILLLPTKNLLEDGNQSTLWFVATQYHFHFLTFTRHNETEKNPHNVRGNKKNHFI